MYFWIVNFFFFLKTILKHFYKIFLNLLPFEKYFHPFLNFLGDLTVLAVHVVSGSLGSILHLCITHTHTHTHTYIYIYIYMYIYRERDVRLCVRVCLYMWKVYRLGSIWSRVVFQLALFFPSTEWKNHVIFLLNINWKISHFLRNII